MVLLPFGFVALFLECRFPPRCRTILAR